MKDARKKWPLRLAKGTWLLYLALPGCSGNTGQDRPPLYAVHGQAFFQGQPIPKAILIFHPLGQTGLGNAKPRATVSADGSFQVYSFVAGDGAPEGEYTVTVLWTKPQLDDRAKRQKSESIGSDDTFPDRYRHPTTSGLHIQVHKGPNALPPFFLTK
jgi:hypothetical protein